MYMLHREEAAAVRLDSDPKDRLVVGEPPFR